MKTLRTKLILLAIASVMLLINVAPALAYGKSCYYSYVDSKDASLTTETDKNGSD